MEEQIEATVELEKIKKEVETNVGVTQPQKELPTTKNPAPVLHANEKGLLVGGTLEEQFRIATAYQRSGLVPAALSTPEKVLIAMQFARELGLPPVSAMRQICIINGTPSLWGELPLALVIQSGVLEDFGEELLDEDWRVLSIENGNMNSPVWAARAWAKRKNGPRVERIFTMADADTAGLINKNRSLWKVYPKRMIQMRTRSWVLKDVAPDVLMGAAIAEYDFDIIPDSNGKPINITPAAKLKEALEGPTEGTFGEFA